MIQRFDFGFFQLFFMYDRITIQTNNFILRVRNMFKFSDDDIVKKMAWPFIIRFNKFLVTAGKI
jgi:hypothetical protein